MSGRTGPCLPPLSQCQDFVRSGGQPDLTAAHLLEAALVVYFVIYSQIAVGSLHVDIFIALVSLPKYLL